MTEAEPSLYLYLIKASLSSGTCWAIAVALFFIIGGMTGIVGGFWCREWWKREWDTFQRNWCIFGLLGAGVAAVYISAKETRAKLEGIQRGEYRGTFAPGKKTTNEPGWENKIITAALESLREFDWLLEAVKVEEVLKAKGHLDQVDMFSENGNARRELVGFCVRLRFAKNGKHRLEQLRQCEDGVPSFALLLASIWALTISLAAYRSIRSVPIHHQLKPYITYKS